MTESTQITLIIAGIALAAFIGIYLLIKKQTTNLLAAGVNSKEQELTKSIAHLNEQLEDYRAENSLLKEHNASATSTIEHFNQLELKHESALQQLQTKQNELSKFSADLKGVTIELRARESQLLEVKETLQVVTKNFDMVSEKYTQLNRENAELLEKSAQIEPLKGEIFDLRTELKEREEQLSNHRERLSANIQDHQAQQEKIELLERTEQRLTKEFENLANKIFKEKSGVISEQNKTSLDSLLTPLKEQIGSFSAQVSKVYTEEAKERHALSKEVSGLKELNLQMSKEAIALTRALKGDNKKQGTWGEVVLERVLQESGLREGHEYQTQKSLKDIEGKTLKPDVVVHLPGDKDVVIDSKVALVAYERYYNAENDTARNIALKQHVSALKEHIKGLSAKNYQDLLGINTLDYVLMFIPVEPAFHAAIESDPELVQTALEKNIMLVSPTNLTVALKTINNMWRVEFQNQNALEIASKAGAIYDKLVGFVEDMEKLGRNLKTADVSYQSAMKKLSSGSGNLIRRAESMKQLRIASKKNLPKELVEDSDVLELLT